MRLALVICLAAALLFSSCAHEGTIVRKAVRALPFAGSLGIEAIFRFEVRDREGHIHRQVVTPEVYARYKVGDYFNDRERPAFRSELQTRPAPWLTPGMQPRPLQDYGTHYRSMPPPSEPLPETK
ncbi:MAG: hypothetical protein ABIR38_00530 [Chthoniobacterales bacterium]